MPDYRLAGDVTFSVMAEWDDIQCPPTRAEAVSALQAVTPTDADFEFTNVKIVAATSPSCQPAPDDASGEVLAKLLLDATDLSEARVSITGTTTVRVEETIYWEEAPSDERVTQILSDEAPCSVLNIDAIENISVEQTAD